MSAEAPFCSAKFREQPRKPNNGMSTSLAATKSTPATAARAGAKSTSVTLRSCHPPASREVSEVAPSAASMPAPASLVAEPPSPTMILVAPSATAALII